MKKFTIENDEEEKKIFLKYMEKLKLFLTYNI